MRKVLPASFPLYLKTRRIGGHFRLRTADRIFLEETVIPWFRHEAKVSSVLDVGCDWYTRSYPSLLAADRHETIDFDPLKQLFATGHRHHVGSLLELERFCKSAAFDLVICNGVPGWGINGESDINAAARQIARATKPGGWLVLGWNDMPPWRPEPMECFDLPPFERMTFPPINSDTFLSATKSRHTYRFYKVTGG